MPGAQVKLSSLSFFFPSTCVYLVSGIIRHGGVEKCTHSPDSQSWVGIPVTLEQTIKGWMLGLSGLKQHNSILSPLTCISEFVSSSIKQNDNIINFTNCYKFKRHIISVQSILTIKIMLFYYYYCNNKINGNSSIVHLACITFMYMSN